MNLPKKNLFFCLSLVFGMMILGACSKKGNHMPLNPSTNSQNPGQSGKLEPIKECSVVTQFELGYKEDILPILEKRCSECHSEGKTSAALQWTNYQTFFNARQKLLVRLFDKQDMPPAGKPKPTSDELDAFKKWVEIGAPVSKQVVDNSNCPKEEPIQQEPPQTQPENPQEPVPPAPLDPPNNPQPEPGNQVVTYDQHIKPLLKTYCSACHSFGDLNWEDYSLLKSRVDNGVLANRLFDKKDMPMAGMPQPTAAELEVFRRWIDQGGVEKEEVTLTFEKDVKPILNSYCTICHSAGPLNWLDYENLKIRVNNGSLEKRLFVSQDMPMSGFNRPSLIEYEILRKWIASGAKEK